MARRVQLEPPPTPQDRERFEALLEDAKRAIGANIRQLRNDAGKMSLRKLGIRADLSPTFISEIENGERAASIESLIRITQALGVKISAILPDDL